MSCRHSRRPACRAVLFYSTSREECFSQPPAFSTSLCWRKKIRKAMRAKKKFIKKTKGKKGRKTFDPFFSYRRAHQSGASRAAPPRRPPRVGGPPPGPTRRVRRGPARPPRAAGPPPGPALLLFFLANSECPAVLGAISKDSVRAGTQAPSSVRAAGADKRRKAVARSGGWLAVLTSIRKP